MLTYDNNNSYINKTICISKEIYEINYFYLARRNCKNNFILYKVI